MLTQRALAGEESLQHLTKQRWREGTNRFGDRGGKNKLWYKERMNALRKGGDALSAFHAKYGFQPPSKRQA